MAPPTSQMCASPRHTGCSPSSRLYTPTLSSLAKSRAHGPSEAKGLERMPAATSPNSSPSSPVRRRGSTSPFSNGSQYPSPPISPPTSPRRLSSPGSPRRLSPPGSPNRLGSRTQPPLSSPASPGWGERNAPSARRNSPPGGACESADSGESLAMRLRRQVQEQQRQRQERRQQQQQQRRALEEEQRRSDERSDWSGSPRITLMAVGRQEPLVSRRMEKTAELTAQLTELRQMTVELPDETESDDSSSVNDSGSVNEASSGSGEWESDDADSLSRVKHLRYKLAASPVSVLDLKQQVTGMKKRGEEYDSDAGTTTSSGNSGELDPSLVLQDLVLSRNLLPPPALSSLPPLSSPSPPLHSSSLSPPPPSPPPLSPCPAESLALLDLSSTQSVLADVAAAEGLADVAGIEQDLEYVRHVLLLSGFAGESLPLRSDIPSVRLPVRREVFEQLEREITGEINGSSSSSSSSICQDSGTGSPRATPLDAATDAGSQSSNGGSSSSSDTRSTKNSEERRQRMLLFDAINEAIGRTLAPFLNPPQWDLDTCPSSAARPVSLRKLHPRPVGKDLLKKIWVEIHDWPIPPSPDVYDVLDDAARRDMQKGVDRWSQEEIRDSEAATVAFDLEDIILDALVEAACKEYSEAERDRVERRQVRELQRKAAQEEQERERRRWSIGGRACAAGSDRASNVSGRTTVWSGSAGRMGRAATPQRGAGGARSSSSERAAGKGVGLHGVDRTPARPTTPVRAATPGRGVRASGAGRVGQRPVGGAVSGDVDRRWRN
ncbi:unnamed protein product [Closterium sp. Naga37s-1]|nr:unnamed protein product [Closterium sp. Naga37s-1]